MITGLYMGWTDPNSGAWFPVEKMTWQDGKYYTVHLEGMKSTMEINQVQRTIVKCGLARLDRVEVSSNINVSFRTKMPVNRPYRDVIKLERLGLSTDLTQFDAFEYTARTSGKTKGNHNDLFPEVTPDPDGKYRFYFGIGNLNDAEVVEQIQKVQLGDLLTIEDKIIYHDHRKVDTAPGYVADLAKHHPQAIDLTVVKVNDDISSYNKLLCCFAVDGRITVPFSDPQYQPLVDVKKNSPEATPDINNYF